MDLGDTIGLVALAVIAVCVVVVRIRRRPRRGRWSATWLVALERRTDGDDQTAQDGADDGQLGQR